MEFSSAIIGVVCIILFFLPIYLLNRTAAQKQKKRLSALLTFSEKNNLKLSVTDAWNDCAIGIDQGLKQVAYVKNAEDDHQEFLIDLKDISRCSINNASREIKTSGKTQRIIEKLELQFIPKKSDNPLVALEFYDGRKQFQLSGELQLIEKWVALLRQSIS